MSGIEDCQWCGTSHPANEHWTVHLLASTTALKAICEAPTESVPASTDTRHVTCSRCRGWLEGFGATQACDDPVERRTRMLDRLDAVVGGGRLRQPTVIDTLIEQTVQAVASVADDPKFQVVALRQAVIRLDAEIDALPQTEQDGIKNGILGAFAATAIVNMRLASNAWFVTFSMLAHTAFKVKEQPDNADLRAGLGVITDGCKHLQEMLAKVTSHTIGVRFEHDSGPPTDA